MTDVEAAAASSQGTPKKEATKTKPKVGKAKPSHPSTSEMVKGAIKSLDERGGSSLQAIKKYIASNYKVDAEKVAPLLKRYLKSAVLSGRLVQTKGKGANGSFKIGGDKKGEKKPVGDKKKEAKGKKAAAAKPKKATDGAKTKKAASKPKKTPAAKPKKPPAKATKPKTPKEPKTLKPKKAAAKKTTKKAPAPKKK